jgi:hypothetical protein
MSPLKASFPVKVELISSTKLVSHLGIVP